MKLTNKKYGLDVDPQNLAPELFYNCDRTFGNFIEDGQAYVVTDRNTPRDWFQYLCNDKFFSAITNTGLGFTDYKIGNFKITKYYEEMNYLPRIPNGGRKIIIYDVQSKCSYDFFDDCKDLIFIVRPGYVEFLGHIGELEITVTVFVPNEDTCECWKVKFKNLLGEKRTYKVSFGQDWAFAYGRNGHIVETQKTSKDITVKVKDTGLFEIIYGVFAMTEAAEIETAQYVETVWSKPETFTKVSMTTELTFLSAEEKTILITSGAGEEMDYISYLKSYYSVLKNYDAELDAVKEKWNRHINRNMCKVPDKNFQYFINIWLKNQLDLTYRYCRLYNIGYRDNMQDAWAYTLVNPLESRRKLLEGLSYMYTDGRCARTYNTVEGHVMKDDFCDSPVWIPNTLTTIIKETGDYSILDEILPYLGSDKKGTVKEHVLVAFELLWQLRGENGLILMREGDWLDGLSGIQKYGEGATSAWCTIAAYWGQKQLAELFVEIGDLENAELMRERNAAYKKAFNEVAWDGKWCIYAFFEDGEPIGSSQNYEGKIYLNAQTWAIFSGILDDERKIPIIEKSIQRYLMTPFGCQLMEPPYVLYGGRCGRIQNQIPGTFANGAIYNHAASMKIFSDAVRGDGDDAYDTFTRCCPNNKDNSDLRRTSEPYCVGNVYYGPDHSHYGMNLFSWFTGSAAWLMQGGFTQILGVKPGYHGIEIDPHVPAEWNEFDVKKTYRGSVYNIHFLRSESNEIWLDGVKVNGNTVITDKETCEVLVKFK